MSQTPEVKAASRYASRKFILAAVAFVAILVLLLLGNISAELFTENLRWVLGLYFTGNVAMAAVSKVVNKND